MSRHLRQWATAKEAAEACAREALRLLSAREGTVSLAVSGGSTPRLLFDALARAEFAWPRLHLFWVDERMVPPTQEESNYRLAEQHLIHPAGIPAANIHRIAGELEPAVAAARYASEVREFFHLAPGEAPRFDVIHRGKGADAHTASLFPGEPLIHDRSGIAAAVWVEKLARWRVTLLPGVLLAARNTLMLVSGADKVPALRKVFLEPYDPLRYPAQLGVPDGKGMSWYLDINVKIVLDQY